MTLAWPVSLPQMQFEFDENTPPTTVSDEMDGGEPKSHQIATATWDEFVGTLMLTADQVTTYKEFFHVDCKGGTQTFEFKHPRTGQYVNMKFKENFTPTGRRKQTMFEYQIELRTVV
jgi:hypothetical protein